MTPDQLAHLRNKKIGFVFQKFNLIADLTALDNVALPSLYAGNSEHDARAKALELLTTLELDHRAHHVPYQLSGGQQQRVAIARALINNPSIILADEPTGNLDSKTGERIMQMFFELNIQQNITIILITHDAALAKKAKRVINIHDGILD
jgi:putative ABC transport system ATP-binding protein